MIRPSVYNENRSLMKYAIPEAGINLNFSNNTNNTSLPPRLRYERVLFDEKLFGDEFDSPNEENCVQIDQFDWLPKTNLRTISLRKNETFVADCGALYASTAFCVFILCEKAKIEKRFSQQYSAI